MSDVLLDFTIEIMTLHKNLPLPRYCQFFFQIFFLSKFRSQNTKKNKLQINLISSTFIRYIESTKWQNQ